jgi:hypothetical protein
MKSHTLTKAIACLLLPGAAAAQAPAEEWEGRVAIYGYLPDIGGHARFAGPAGGEIEIDNNDLIRNTEMALMTSVEAQKGRWGIFGDIVYMDVSDEITNSPTLGQGAVPLPLGLTADAAVTVKASVLTFAGNFRVLESPRNVFDAFAGLRQLDVDSTLDASLSSPLGPVAAVSSTVDKETVDVIVGVKGKVNFAAAGRWFLPYYVDVGGGDADRTSQAVLGIGYTTKRGEVFGTYRYVDYDMNDEAMLADLDLSGPAVGFAFRF